MTINKIPRILVAAVVVAAAITVLKLYSPAALVNGETLTYKCFEQEAGWGYDIVTGGRIIIHQSIDPALPGRRGFATKAQAAADAAIVIGKIKLGETPAFNVPVKQQTGIFPAQ